MYKTVYCVNLFVKQTKEIYNETFNGKKCNIPHGDV